MLTLLVIAAWTRPALGLHMTADNSFMRQAIDLALLGQGKTDPNPIVGCLIVRDGEIIGKGYHPSAGEPHAEIFALRDAGMVVERDGDRWDVSGDAVAGSTAYVTLEPCSHVGRTPPCCDALLAAKVARVVIGIEDPAPWVSGNGISRLREGGVTVDVGVESDSCREINRDWISRLLSSAA